VNKLAGLVAMFGELYEDCVAWRAWLF